MEYILQTDDITCGPVAVFNAMVWAGSAIKPNKLSNIIYKCLEEDVTYIDDDLFAPDLRGKGITHQQLTLAIETTPCLMLSKIIDKPHIQQIKRHLNTGGSAIISFMPTKAKPVGHYSFCPSCENNLYTLINHLDINLKYAHTDLTHKNLAQLLSINHNSKKSQCRSKAWLLRSFREQDNKIFLPIKPRI